MLGLDFHFHHLLGEICSGPQFNGQSCAGDFVGIWNFFDLEFELAFVKIEPGLNIRLTALCGMELEFLLLRFAFWFEGARRDEKGHRITQAIIDNVCHIVNCEVDWQGRRKCPFELYLVALFTCFRFELNVVDAETGDHCLVCAHINSATNYAGIAIEVGFVGFGYVIGVAGVNTR
ncbi:hypothetical protein ES703_121964 [subsurface metagenome]